MSINEKTPRPDPGHVEHSEKGDRDSFRESIDITPTAPAEAAKRPTPMPPESDQSTDKGSR